MINQVNLRRRAERNVRKRVCSYCDLVLKSRRVNSARNKSHLTQRRNYGKDVIDLRKHLVGPHWGVWRDCDEEIIDLRNYLPKLSWSVQHKNGTQDDAAGVVQEGAENAVEEKASEVDDGDAMNQEISTSKSFDFNLNELPPAEERGD